ncbi:MAG: hypothetical protein KF699_12665 [Phycisphaeraceae bacterium]|nr:hypothetical protein [Phycisphaeraceae bacterium]
MPASLAIRWAARSACVMAAAALPACRSSGAAADGAAAVARFVVLGEAPAGAEAAEFRAPGGSRAVFAPWESDGSARLEIERAEPDDSGRYVQRRWAVRGAERTLVREQRLVSGDDGAVLLAEEINHAEKVEVVFTPPLVVVPALLTSGVEARQRARMAVYPLGDRARTRARGTVEQTIVVGQTVRVRTPAGECDARTLVSEFRADLGASKVQNRTETWLAPGIGIIAEQRQERTTALGVPIRNNRESWVVIELPR